LLFVLLGALALLGGLWFLTSDSGSSLLPEVIASESDEAGAGLGLGDRNGDSSEDEEDAGRRAIDIPPPPPTAEELAAALDAPDSQVWGRVLGIGGVPLEGAEVITRTASRWVALPTDLEDVEIWGRGDESWSALTDEDGLFHFDDLEPDDYGFAVRIDGYAPHGRHSEKIPEHEQYQLGDFQLQQGVVVEGKVTDHRGKPVEGVRVLRAISTKGGSTRLVIEGLGVPLDVTDVDGAFRAAILTPGSWHLLFDAPAYRVAELTGVTEPAGSSERGVRVVLEKGLQIEGHVEGLAPTEARPLRIHARRSDEQPTGDAVGVEPAERERSRFATVSADSQFVLTGLSPNTQYQLMLQQQVKEDDELVPADHAPWRDMPGVSNVTAMAGDKDVELRYREEASLALKVVDVRTAKPITIYSARVWGNGLGGAGTLETEDGETATSHPGGEALFEHLRPRRSGSDTTVFVRAEGYRDLLKKNFVLVPGEEKDLGTLEMEPAPRVPVRVVDDATGETIAGARVFLAGSAFSESLEGLVETAHDHIPDADEGIFCELTDERGAARITALPGKLCRLRAVAKGYSPCDALTSAPPHELDLELRLTRCGTVTVKVLDEEGEPVPGAQIRRQREDGGGSQYNYWDSGSSARASTDESGSLLIDDLRPGRWTFWVMDEQEANMSWYRGPDQAQDDEKESLRLESGEDAEIELTVKATGGALVRVTEGGEASVGTLIQLKQILPEGSSRVSWWWGGGGSDDPLRRVTDHEGRAVFVGLELGRYHVTISHPRHRMAREFELLVEAAPEQEQHFELGTTAIEGVVVNTSGDPIPGLRVSIRVAEGNRLWANDHRVKIALDQDGDVEYEWESVDQGTLRTDRDGRYLIEGVRPELSLNVEIEGSYVVPETRRIDALMRDEIRVGVDFVLAPAGILDVEVKGLGGRNRGGVQLRCRRHTAEGEDPVERTTGLRRRRSRRFNSLLPGPWTVDLLASDGETVMATVEVEVVAGEKRRAVLQL